MLSLVAWLIAAVCAAAFAALWCWEVRRIMRDRKSTLVSAEGQLSVCRKKAESEPDNLDVIAVLHQSERIYLQAIELYQKTRRKPWIWLPAVLMGFRAAEPQKINYKKRGNV